LVEVLESICYGNGDSYGYGDGYGNGDGDGYGDGDGDGNSDGYGCGYGYGYGYGNGYGNGYGDGNGDGYDNGNSYGGGIGNGYGYGYGDYLITDWEFDVDGVKKRLSYEGGTAVNIENGGYFTLTNIKGETIKVHVDADKLPSIDRTLTIYNDRYSNGVKLL